jgi:3-hydroxyisobutyrate dehydrogenase
MQLGFLGLGQMGAAIAERLELAGAKLHVFDPNQAATAPFVARGAIRHDSPTGVADAARIVFACLPNGSVSEAVAKDVASGSAVRLYVEMSTIGSPTLARVQDIVETGPITLVDCPISGGPKGARAGTLTVITAGPEVAREELRPWLQAIGGTCSRLGTNPDRRS